MINALEGFLALADFADMRHQRDQQPRDHGAVGIDLDVHRQLELTQPVKNLRKAGGAVVFGIELHAAIALQGDEEATLGTQQFGSRPIKRRIVLETIALGFGIATSGGAGRGSVVVKNT